MTVQFSVMCSDGGNPTRPRKEIEAYLDPIKVEILRLGLTVYRITKINYSITCNASKDIFEQVFSTEVTSSSTFIPNLNRPGMNVTNWNATKPIIIPDSLKQLGAVSILIDRKIALTD